MKKSKFQIEIIASTIPTTTSEKLSILWPTQCNGRKNTNLNNFHPSWFSLIFLFLCLHFTSSGKVFCVRFIHDSGLQTCGNILSFSPLCVSLTHKEHEYIKPAFSSWTSGLYFFLDVLFLFFRLFFVLSPCFFFWGWGRKTEKEWEVAEIKLELVTQHQSERDGVNESELIIREKLK